MKPCTERVVECPSSPKPCKFHKECDWCGKFHFVKEDPIDPEPPGTPGSRQIPYSWPPKFPLNVACVGRRNPLQTKSLEGTN